MATFRVLCFCNKVPLIEKGLCHKILAVSTSRHKEAHLTSTVNLHTSSRCDVDRRKDTAVAKHLHYRNYEKTMRHRNLPLVELPDYSYVDGRATEIAIRQKNRNERNYDLAKQVVQLLGEIKFAQDELKRSEQEKLDQQQQRLSSALKEKGKGL
ncbi:uncharacterized protein LOC131949994 [Physella acuta]|uniref:uncharacterized protein LOC131949994 n=1 Tax=Physella acuta TaxID=109671 RepID=UPI0027DDF6A4|nr:uncharacterized protein LOC131949994 [Physella acuta]